MTKMGILIIVMFIVEKGLVEETFTSEERKFLVPTQARSIWINHHMAVKKI